MTRSKSIVVVGRYTVAAGLFALALFSTPAPAPRRSAGTIPLKARNLMAAYGAETVTIDRTMRDYRTPDQFPWKGREGSLTQNAAVFGDAAKAGMYVQLLKRGPNDWSEAHSHPNDRYITVLQGTFLIGTGSKVDRNNTVALGPGSIVHDIAGQMHYDGTGPEGATIEIMGMGPATRIAGDSK
jgi:hypothetical protein